MTDYICIIMKRRELFRHENTGKKSKVESVDL